VRTILITLMAIVAFALPLSAQGPQAMERDSWAGPINPGSTVEVHNPYGDIRLRHGGFEGRLEVAAVLQQLAVDGSKLVLEVEIADDTAGVKVVRYNHLGEAVASAPNGDQGRADLAVLIPEGFPTRAETGGGLIEARGVASDVEIRTDSGTIRVAKTSGRITAHSASGAMEITLETGTTKKAQSFSSVTGHITVFTAPTNDLDVTMATSGAFITDYSLDISHQDQEEPNKTATSIIGDGGPDLVITSKRGDLALRRVVTIDTD